MLHDLRIALRGLRRRPAFVLTSVLVLGLGIGANTAIFTIFRGILLQPLPYPEPHRLVSVWEDHSPRGGPDREWTSRSTLWDWREQNRSFTGIAGYVGWEPVIGGVQPVQVGGFRVTADFFEILGVEPSVGRLFAVEEGDVGAARVAVLSHNFFNRRLGGDPARLGEALEIDGEPHTVVGVLPGDFRSPVGEAEVWRPLPMGPGIEDRGNYYVRTVARLEEGIDRQLAMTDMEKVMAGVAETAPESYQDVKPRVLLLHGQLTESIRPALVALMAAVILLMLVTCANIANLLLARGAGRRREMAIRASIGADRRRLISQMLIESQVLAILGGGLGVGLGVLGCRILVSLAPVGTPRLAEVSPDLGTFGFVAGLSLLTGLAFGILPAFSGARLDLASDLRAGARQTGRSSGLTRTGLVVVEMALALVLLLGAGLLSRSFLHLSKVELGFQDEKVMTASLRLSSEQYREQDARIRFFRTYLERLEARPEIEAVAAVSILPMSGSGTDLSYFIEGTAPPPEGHEPSAWYRYISDDYFSALRIPLIAGRAFDLRDEGEQALRVVAIGKSFAERWFPGADPLGRRLKLGPAESSAPWVTVVAVVADIHDRSPMLPAREDLYLPISQGGPGSASIVARGAAGVVPLASLTAPLTSLDPSLPLSWPMPLSDMVHEALWLPRLTTQLMLAFSFASLFLAALGVYSVLAFTVLERRREVGIRMALGAAPRQILGQMLRLGLKPAVVGTALGLLASAGALRFLDNLVFGIDLFDPISLLGASGFLLITAAAASLIPAWRASRIEPTRSLM